MLKGSFGGGCFHLTLLFQTIPSRGHCELSFVCSTFKTNSPLNSPLETGPDARMCLAEGAQVWYKNVFKIITVLGIVFRLQGPGTNWMSLDCFCIPQNSPVNVWKMLDYFHRPSADMQMDKVSRKHLEMIAHVKSLFSGMHSSQFSRCLQIQLRERVHSSFQLVVIITGTKRSSLDRTGLQHR